MPHSDAAAIVKTHRLYDVDQGNLLPIWCSAISSYIAATES